MDGIYDVLDFIQTLNVGDKFYYILPDPTAIRQVRGPCEIRELFTQNGIALVKFAASGRTMWWLSVYTRQIHELVSFNAGVFLTEKIALQALEYRRRITNVENLTRLYLEDTLKGMLRDIDENYGK